MKENAGFFKIETTKKGQNWSQIQEHRMHQLDLRNGLSLSSINLKADSDAEISYRIEKPIIGFGCILSGNVENDKDIVGNRLNPLKSRAGIGGISFFTDAEGVIRKAAGHAARVLHILITPDTLASMYESDMDDLPVQLQQLCEGRLSGEFRLLGKMSPAVKSVAHQVANGAPQGVNRRLYLEGRTLELIALQVALLKAGDQSNSYDQSLSPMERDKIIHIGEQLLQHQDSPPSLQTLAKQANLSINKLERGFRKVYGMPVFAFIRESKMQKARLLFLETSMNVSEVAWEVGYVNVSHFGAAFKKRFGILPKQFIKKYC